MLRLGPFRVGQGFALVFSVRQFVMGGGTKSFMEELDRELGFRYDRPHFPRNIVPNVEARYEFLYEDHDSLN